ncbi:ATP-binding protein [Metabacillus sp. Hm71]|uniref:ATP-binding protein n=1 Tax=Metabacillus sp. Hm71 TaxID=3450743 RepID=UPI003F41FF16
MERMLFNVKPDLRNKALNIELIKLKCAECDEGQLFGWKYNIDDIEHQYLADQMCTKCKNKVMAKELTTEFEQKRLDQFLNNWWFIEDNDESGFKNYKPTNEVTTKAKEKTINYMQRLSQKSLSDEKNLLIMGNPGTGKTHLSKAIARTLKSRGFKVGFIPSVDLFSKFKATFDGKGSAERIFADMKKLDVLVIDDIGVETTKVSDVSWTIRTWNEIINCRLGLPNIWTTNLDDSKLADFVGERAHSRMYENTRFIDLFTDDYRKSKRVED